MGKREDLQFLRGTAVLAVVLYHFFPNFVPNGFVGVDQFFVLSGFLMMMVYGARDINVSSTAAFYYRRIKRIVPLYLVALLATLAAIYFIFPISFMLGNANPTIPALFYSNIFNMGIKNSYFEQLQRGSYLYTHTWSLGVEMQFYVVAPLFFTAQMMLRQVHVVAETIYLSFVFYASLAAHLTLDNNVAFNSLHCRLWQFVVGILCYRICAVHEEAEKEEEKLQNDELERNKGAKELAEIHITCKKSKTVAEDCNSTDHAAANVLLFYSLLAALFFIVFVPFKEHMVTIRIVGTILTGLVIVAEPRIGRMSPMKNRAICYIGDISYSLYLIHWSICSYAKYLYDQDVYQYFIAFALCFPLAALSYEFIEKSYLKLGMVWIIVIIAALYIALFAAIAERGALIKWTESRCEAEVAHFNISALTRDNIATLNELANFQDENQLIDANCNPNQMFGRFVGVWAEGQFVNPRGREQLCEQPGQSRLEIFYGICEFHHKDFRWSCSGNSHAAIKGPLKDDQYVQEIRANLERLQKVVKKRIYVLNCIPQVTIPATVSYMGRLNRMIINGKPVDDEQLMGYKLHNNGRKRFDLIPKMCKKCVLFDIMPAMSDANGKFHVADPKTNLSYYTAFSHLTKYGLEAVSPVYGGLAKKLENLLDSEHQL